MNHGQWRLIYPGTDYTFGTGDLPVFNQKSPEIGTPEVQAADTDRPQSDGRAFGVDFYGGQSISFDLGVRAPSDAEVRDVVAQFRNIWRADAVRMTPGAVAELRCQYAGRERGVFGRPRRFSPDFSDAAVNRYVQVLADFTCADDVFYGTADEAISFGIVPPSGGGLIAPLASPLATTLSSDRSQGIHVVTEAPAWPVVTIYGPVTNPGFNIGENIRMEVRVTLTEGEYVVIDTRPWARTALRNGTSTVAGAVRGTRLSKASVLSGAYEVGFRGLDPTGTARIKVAWRRAYASL